MCIDFFGAMSVLRCRLGSAGVGLEKIGKIRRELDVDFGFADDGRLVATGGRPNDLHCIAIVDVAGPTVREFE